MSFLDRGPSDRDHAQLILLKPCPFDYSGYIAIGTVIANATQRESCIFAGREGTGTVITGR